MIAVPDSIRQKVVAALSGDSSSLGVAFEWFRPRLYAHALRICGNTPLAQDAVQDTFIAAYTHSGQLRDAGSFYPWLKKILVNNCYQLLRKEKAGNLDAINPAHEGLIHRSLEAQLDKVADHQLLFETLLHLSEDLRACVLLRYFTEFNRYDQMANLLGIPVGTVRSRLSAARQKLTAVFLEKGEAGDAALREAGQWSTYYRRQWQNMYDDLQVRNELFNHLHPSLKLRFTSGKTDHGRRLLESEISDDLQYGSRFEVSNVVSSGNISVVEGPNLNHPNLPYRCAPSSAFVLFREGDMAVTMHIFDSPR